MTKLNRNTLIQEGKKFKAANQNRRNSKIAEYKSAKQMQEEFFTSKEPLPTANDRALGKAKS